MENNGRGDERDGMIGDHGDILESNLGFIATCRLVFLIQASLLDTD